MKPFSAGFLRCARGKSVQKHQSPGVLCCCLCGAVVRSGVRRASRTMRRHPPCAVLFAATTSAPCARPFITPHAAPSACRGHCAASLSRTPAPPTTWRHRPPHDPAARRMAPPPTA
eukprot:357044-Chlamydomonas_euryale.AAC.3